MVLKIGTLEADINGNTTGLKLAEKEVNKSTTRINSQLKKTEKASAGVSKGFKLAGRSAGQAGIQIQQFVGQIQGGQSVFLAFSQQAADFGIVLGAPLIGVVVSLAAVVAGVLFNAFNQSAEAMERAKTKASDLGNEYLKLTGLTKELAVARLAQTMLTDAAAVVVLGKELNELDKKRTIIAKRTRRGGAVVGGRRFAKSEQLLALDKEIADTRERFDTLVLLNENRQRQIAAFAAEQRGETEETAIPFGAQTFNEQIQQEIAALQLRSKLFNDSNAAIEAEIMRFELAALNLFEVGSEDFLAAEQALADKRIELRQAADDKVLEQNKRANQLLENQQKASQARALSGMAQLGDQINKVIEASGKEGTAIAKAAFLASKAIAVAQIIANTQVGAAKAIGIAGPFGIPASTVIQAAGFASAALVAGLSVGEAFQHGGIVGGTSFSGDNVLARVNSGEMILNRGQQAKLFNQANGGGGSGTPNVTVINNGTPQQVESVQVTEDRLQIVMSDAINKAVGRVDASFATGRGSTAKAFKQGFRADRNVRT